MGYAKPNVHDVLIYSYDDDKEEFGAFAYVGANLLYPKRIACWSTRQTMCGELDF